MEFLVALVIIVVLLLLLGVGVDTLIVGAGLLIYLLIVLMLLMFTYSLLVLLTSKTVKANFSKIDKAPKGKFNVAYYICDGEEYPCAFPSEPLLKNFFYPPDKLHKVRLNRRRKNIYDKYAAITCMIGFVFSFAVVFGGLHIYFMV